MLVYIKTTPRSKLPEGVKRQIGLLNRKLRANAITLDTYTQEAKKLKPLVPSNRVDALNNMLMVSV